MESRCFFLWAQQCKAPLIHTKIKLKCKPRGAQTQRDLCHGIPISILPPIEVPGLQRFHLKKGSLTRPSPSHILLTFFATQTASPNASLGDIADSHGLLLVSHLFRQAYPRRRDAKGVLREAGWGGWLGLEAVFYRALQRRRWLRKPVIVLAAPCCRRHCALGY